MVRIVGPVSGMTAERGAVFDETRDRIMGGIATYHDWFFQWFMNLPGFAPRYQAYREFDLGVHFVGNDQLEDAIDHFGRSYKMDTLMRYALQEEMNYRTSLDDNHGADSVLKILEGMRSVLTKEEILLTEYVRAYMTGDAMTAYSRAKEAFQLWPRGWGLNFSAYSVHVNYLREAIAANSRSDTTIFNPSWQADRDSSVFPASGTRILFRSAQVLTKSTTRRVPAKIFSCPLAR